MRKVLLYSAAALVILLIVAVIGVDRYVRSLGPRARERVIRALADRFDANVELKSLELKLFPRPSVAGVGLFIRYPAWPADHPFIGVQSFSANSNFADLLFERDKVSE